jgi:glycosyltransferase involved in cell wall biosynthesis
MDRILNSSGIVVVVPFFNRRNTIPATLASIETQTLLPQRVILVDDGSTDGGADVAYAWAHRLRGRLNCSLERQANSGVSAARNRGLELAGECDYIAFLDSDDRWLPGHLANGLTALLLGADFFLSHR